MSAGRAGGRAGRAEGFRGSCARSGFRVCAGVHALVFLCLCGICPIYVLHMSYTCSTYFLYMYHISCTAPARRSAQRPLAYAYTHVCVWGIHICVYIYWITHIVYIWWCARAPQHSVCAAFRGGAGPLRVSTRARAGGRLPLFDLHVYTHTHIYICIYVYIYIGMYIFMHKRMYCVRICLRI